MDSVGRLRIDEAIRDPGFTPSVRDLGALVERLGRQESSRDAERAIARIGPAAVPGLLERFGAAGGADKASMVRTLGRFVSEPTVRAALIDALSDPHPVTRRRAATALGHARAQDQDAEQALLDAWSRDRDGIVHRRIAEALGKVGTSASLTRLRDAVHASDEELGRIAQRALTMVERTGSRPDRGRIDPNRIPSRPLRVHIDVRRGLADILIDELRAIPEVGEARAQAPERVAAELRGPLVSLFGARTMLSFAFPLPEEPRRQGETVEDAIARALEGPIARDVFATWTSGAVRYRLRWASGRHRRATTWNAARAVSRVNPNLVNDPTASLWEVRVSDSTDLVEVALAPRALHDPRFAWRHSDVPAASHPTVAAALARIAGTRADDVVWDPFVGSAGELIERARLGPTRALHGSDTDARALAAARENLEAAGVHAHLEHVDSLDWCPEDVTLVITNPPMGRRASRTSGLAELLDRFVEHAANALVPGGRFVWIAPWPTRSRAVAARCGLALDWSSDVDMGGFDAQIQRFHK
jgi:predicted RNA methylase